MKKHKEETAKREEVLKKKMHEEMKLLESKHSQEL